MMMMMKMKMTMLIPPGSTGRPCFTRYGNQCPKDCPYNPGYRYMKPREVGDTEEVGGPWKGERVHEVAVTRVSEARGRQRKAALTDGRGRDEE